MTPNEIEALTLGGSLFPWHRDDLACTGADPQLLRDAITDSHPANGGWWVDLARVLRFAEEP